MNKNENLLDKFRSSSKKDIKHIEELLSSLNAYYQDLSSLYSIREDLVEITDKRRGLAKQLTKQLDTFKGEARELKRGINSELTEYKKLRAKSEAIMESNERFSEDIKELKENLYAEDENGQSSHDALLRALTKENIERLEKRSKNIDDFWRELHFAEDGSSSIYDKTKKSYEAINGFHNYFISKNEGESSKKDEILNASSSIEEEYEKIISGYKTVQDGEEIDVSPYSKQIKEQKDELNIFYKKVFGHNDSEGLESELDERLKQLASVEIEAKKVIGLSSDAGLAGGFSERGRKARNNKFVSMVVFIAILVALGALNLFDFEEGRISLEMMKEIKDINMLAIKLIYSAPFIWIAIVANVNLNKYSRLEEEYAHKESLSKSFERYKEQIQAVDDCEESRSLMLRLLKANISAFEKNAADTMDKAKADTIIPETRRKKQESDSTVQAKNVTEA